MFKSSVYSLVTVPLKKSHKTGNNNQLDVKTPSEDTKNLERLRASCVEQFDKLRKNAENVRALDSFLSTESEREKYLAAVVNAAEAYAAALIEFVKRFPKYGIVKYYMWSSSLCQKQEIAYDDYRYDLACVYYNVAALLLNMGQYTLCVRASVGTISALEKEAYRTLLRAAGYFCASQSLVAEIKKEPIGMAEVPVPLDTAVTLLSLLESVALAQAQEIGTNKAIAADPKGEKETTARLCHQAYLLYQCAKDSVQGVASRCKEFDDVTVLVMVKCDVYKALSYNYAASCSLSTKPGNALWLMDKANQHAQTVSAYQSRKVKIAFGGEKVVAECLTTIRRNSERITKINSLVHRAKPSTTTVPLPPYQILAQKTEIRLPAPLPPAAASLSVPPEVLDSGESNKPVSFSADETQKPK